MKKVKTYDGLTLREIKQKHPNMTFVYCRYRGTGDHGLMASTNPEIFYCDDLPLMNRYVKARINNYTGIINNVDYSCEVFIDGDSLGKSTKHKARKFLKLIKQGIEIDSDYLSSRRPYHDFLSDASTKAKEKTEINRLAHQLIEGEGKSGHDARNIIRSYAYKHGIEATKEKFLI